MHPISNSRPHLKTENNDVASHAPSRIAAVVNVDRKPLTELPNIRDVEFLDTELARDYVDRALYEGNSDAYVLEIFKKLVLQGLPLLEVASITQMKQAQSQKHIEKILFDAKTDLAFQLDNYMKHNNKGKSSSGSCAYRDFFTRLYDIKPNYAIRALQIIKTALVLIDKAGIADTEGLTDNFIDEMCQKMYVSNIELFRMIKDIEAKMLEVILPESQRQRLPLLTSLKTKLKTKILKEGQTFATDFAPKTQLAPTDAAMDIE